MLCLYNEGDNRYRVVEHDDMKDDCMKNKSDKKGTKGKKLAGRIVFIILFALIGAGIGFMLAAYADRMVAPDAGVGEYIFMVALLLVGMYVAMFLQTVIHEAGHLIFGLLTGYRFSSFRVGSMMWLRDPDSGKILRKKMSLAGTAGQCLMSPPDLVDGKIPVVLFNFGGAIANVVASVLFLGLYVLTREIRILPMLCLLMVLFGIAFAITNGIPMRVGGVDNDGYNARSMMRDPAAIRSFWVQLKANEQIARGVRLKDMPAEWFYVPDAAGMKNSIVAVMGVFMGNRLMDEQRFCEAEELMERLLKQETAIMGVHRSLMICDLIYCKLLREDSVETVDVLMTEEHKRFMKSMKTFPSVIRTDYAYTLLREKDEKKAAKILEQFNQVAKTYPYPSDIESERELLVLIADNN